MTGITTGDSGRSYSYDALGRISQWVTKHGNDTVFSDEFTFAAPTGTAVGTTTGQIARHYIASSHTDGLDIAYTYTYDDNGNILSISDGTNTTSYVYDTANQLLRENNEAANKTYVWTYDNAGNILSRNEYAYTTAEAPANPIDTVLYTYGDTNWGDLLTAYDGQTITYDTIGNPLTDGTWNYTWQHGRQLASMSNGTTSWSFTYNSDGLRTERTDGTTTYEYTYNGSSLSQMTVGSNTLRFAYDANGFPMSVTYNGTEYYYITNIQGDVIGILDSSGASVVTYTYDAWGNPLTITGSLASTLGEQNPLRFRGYVYDTETELYHLNSRYYNPEMGRFLNSDIYTATGQGMLGNNMFAYCRNNPVCRIDILGTVDADCDGDDDTEDDLLRPDSGGGSGNGSSVGGVLLCVLNTTLSGIASIMDTANFSVGMAAGAGWNGLGAASNLGTTGQIDFTCFVAGTLVLAEGGKIPIEQIQSGDFVWAWDEETGDVALKKVVETYANETDELTHIFVNGEEIITTPTHPFYSPVKGWTDAVHLRAGDILVLVNGEYVVVEKVQHEILEAPVAVYNFQVEDYHTYYVADAGVLVHNDCSKRRTPDQQALDDLGKEIERDARNGKFISFDDAQLLDQWAQEYNVPQHHTALIGSGSHWITGWDHTHIYKTHVPFIN